MSPGPTGMPKTKTFSKPRAILSIPMDRCVKNFLETPLYLELKLHFDVVIVSYLEKQSSFKERFSAPNIRFASEPDFMSSGRRAAFTILDFVRHFGFYFKFRKAETRLHWRGSVVYKYPDDYFPNQTPKPRRVRHLLFWLACFMSLKLNLRKYTVRFLGSWIFANSTIDELFRDPRTKLFVSTAHRTTQEKFLAFHAKKYNVRSVILPDSWDNFVVDGDLIHEFDRFLTFSAAMNDHLVKLHNVEETRLKVIGNPVRRMLFSELDNSSFDLRKQFKIPRSVKIVVLMAVSQSAYWDTFELVDALLAAQDNGSLEPFILLIRTQPGEDPVGYFDRYKTHPQVRIQVAGTRGGGGQAEIDFTREDENLEYAATVARVDAVITNLSACGIDACVAGVPFILNAVELSAYPRGGFSPAALTELDNFGLLQLGLPVAWTLKDLIQITEQALERHPSLIDACERAALKWDTKIHNPEEIFSECVSDLCSDLQT
jgi:hypothetical protein